MRVTNISRGYVEVDDDSRCFRVYGEGLLPDAGGVEYVVYTNSVVECGIANGDGPFKDERKITLSDEAHVLAFLRRWAADSNRRWDFE